MVFENSSQHRIGQKIRTNPVTIAIVQSAGMRSGVISLTGRLARTGDNDLSENDDDNKESTLIVGDRRENVFKFTEKLHSKNANDKP